MIEIHCSNEVCQAPNPITNGFCHQCRTPLLKRYLWAVGRGIQGCDRVGELLEEHYRVVDRRILLDVNPCWLPELPEEIPRDVVPYLKLFSHRLHVPQVYGMLKLPEGNVWLLEAVPISREGKLLPALTEVWQQGNAFRQLHWLWQIARLWQPLNQHGVARTLLTPELLRVEGSLVRILELKSAIATPILAQLGELWQTWAQTAHPAIAPFLSALSQRLQAHNVDAEGLIGVLENALAHWATTPEETLQQLAIATLTNQGPTRKRNEDACYPASGSFLTSATEPLAIVCDGIGGHEGGDVASSMAIDAIQKQVSSLLVEKRATDAEELTRALKDTICEANDLIGEQNDLENKHGRRRMGTTVVSAVVRDRMVYVTHVGDSRVYLVTTGGCHQITVDDDVASREVRLGYSLYRSALRQGASGSLVQALGMNPSNVLHPTVQRFLLDEPCVFLLCSDGLSDRDRVEQYWTSELLPIVEGGRDVKTAARRLVEIANTQNGHDNVTVALVHYQGVLSAKEVAPEALVSLVEALPTTTLPREETQIPTQVAIAEPASPESELQPVLLPQRQEVFDRRSPLLLSLLLFVLVVSGSALAVLRIEPLRQWVEKAFGSRPGSESETLPVDPVAPDALPPVPEVPPAPDSTIPTPAPQSEGLPVPAEGEALSPDGREPVPEAVESAPDPRLDPEPVVPPQ